MRGNGVGSKTRIEGWNCHADSRARFVLSDWPCAGGRARPRADRRLSEPDHYLHLSVPGRRRHRYPGPPAGAELQDKLKRPVIVENRTGAGTVIAADSVAKSPPDGYTLFLAPVTTLAIGPNIYKKLPYDTVKDFAPVGLVGSAQFALIANRDIGAPTLPDLISARQKQERSDGLRHVRRFDAASSVHGDVPEDDRRQSPARALSRQRAGDDGCGVRADPHDDGRSCRRDGPRSARASSKPMV